MLCYVMSTYEGKDIMKKLLILISVFLLSISLVGCNTGGDSKSDNSTTTSKKETTKSDTVKISEEIKGLSKSRVKEIEKNLKSAGIVTENNSKDYVFEVKPTQYRLNYKALEDKLVYDVNKDIFFIENVYSETERLCYNIDTNQLIDAITYEIAQDQSAHILDSGSTVYNGILRKANVNIDELKVFMKGKLNIDQLKYEQKQKRSKDNKLNKIDEETKIRTNEIQKKLIALDFETETSTDTINNEVDFVQIGQYHDPKYCYDAEYDVFYFDWYQREYDYTHEIYRPDTNEIYNRVLKDGITAKYPRLSDYSYELGNQNVSNMSFYLQQFNYLVEETGIGDVTQLQEYMKNVLLAKQIEAKTKDK